MNCWIQYLKTNSIMFLFYDSLVENSNCGNMVVFDRSFLFYILPPYLKPAVNQKNDNDVIISWHNVIVWRL